MTEGVDRLTEREKQTLRLLLAGHDAKSSARELGLSVHTVNERLRDARRKLSVSSSREAARRMAAAETPQSFGPQPIGDATVAAGAQTDAGPTSGPGRAGVRNLIGVLLMSLVAALAILLATPQSAPPVARTPDATDASAEIFAQHWLALLDAGNWADAYAATGDTFRQLNTLARWQDASIKGRAPLGAARSRTLISREDVPVPPRGADVVRFRTDFPNKPGAIETVSLDRENGAWRVVGVWVE